MNDSRQWHPNISTHSLTNPLVFLCPSTCVSYPSPEYYRDTTGHQNGRVMDLRPRYLRYDDLESDHGHLSSHTSSLS